MKQIIGLLLALLLLTFPCMMAAAEEEIETIVTIIPAPAQERAERPPCFPDPADNFILPGTVRKHMLDICHRESIPVIERPFTMDELRDCDEAVVTASFSAVRRAVRLDGSPIGGRNPDLIRLIQDDFAAELTGMME